MMRAAFALAVLLLPLGCSSLLGAAPGPAPRIVFTTALVDEDEPTDRLSRASLQQEKIYLWIRWFDLERAVHSYRIEISDGSGRIIGVGEMKLEPGQTITWHSHRMSPAIETPGTWRFRVFIDGGLRVEQALEVTAAQ